MAKMVTRSFCWSDEREGRLQVVGKKKREASGGREEWRETSGGRKDGGRWILGRGGCSSVRVEERRRNGSWMSRSRRRHVGLEDGAVGRV